MTKREIIKVDEDAIKKMIAGDIPRIPDNMPTEESKVTPKNTPPDKQENSSQENSEDTETKITKKKKNRLKYADLFLVQQKYAETKQTTIMLDKRAYSLIKNILKTTERTTLANFINNVMNHHFSEYKEEIDEVKKEYISNLYNDK
jgi:hypothetical protein